MHIHIRRDRIAYTITILFDILNRCEWQDMFSAFVQPQLITYTLGSNDSKGKIKKQLKYLTEEDTDG